MPPEGRSIVANVVGVTMTSDHPSPSIDRRLLGSLPVGRSAALASVALGILLTVILLAQAVLLAHLLGWIMTRGPAAFPTATTVWLLLSFGARALLGGISEIVAARSGQRVTASLRSQLFDAFSAIGPIGLHDQKTGAMALQATRGIRALEPYFSRYLPAAVVAALAPPLVFVILGIIDWPSALIVLVLVGLIPVFMIRLGRNAARESERQWKRLASLSGRSLELLRGLPTLRGLGQVARGRLEIEAASDAVAESIGSTLRAAMLSTAALEFLAGVGVGLVAMLAGLRLLHGSFGIVPALTVILLAPEVFLPLRRAGAEFHASTEGRAAAETIFATIDAAPDRQSTNQPVTLATPIVASSMTTSYDNSPLFTPCSFTLESGDHLQVRGPSGSGKSTLLRTLCGFIPVASGSLRVGSLTNDAISPAMLTETVSLVPQMPHVFAGSLRDNVTLGLAISDASILEALALVGLDGLAADLDQPLAEQGASLSGGECQRLGLARALVQSRSVVLLDEPTAHLDDLSITVLRERLAPWFAGRVVIETTHRPGLLTQHAQQLDLVPVERAS